MRAKQYGTFRDFYPFYLSEHSNRTCRRLHFIGSTIGLICCAVVVITSNFWWLLVGLVTGYVLAWIGHFFFEKNRPATFTYPLYSFVGDWVMWRDILVRKIKF